MKSGRDTLFELETSLNVHGNLKESGSQRGQLTFNGQMASISIFNRQKRRFLPPTELKAANEPGVANR